MLKAIASQSRGVEPSFVHWQSQGVILRMAHARTFFLLDEIRKQKLEDLVDPDVEGVLSTPVQRELFSN